MQHPVGAAASQFMGHAGRVCERRRVRRHNHLVIWNASSSHKRALGPLMESACDECRYERPANRAVGASPQERACLERQVRRHRVARSLSERCRAILRCVDGLPSKSVAAELGLHKHTVGKWRRRFLKDRCDGLLDEARPGRPRTINDDQVAAVIERTLRTTPADATHWSIRSMAAETGFSHTTIRRMWAAFGLQPHRSQTFKLSSDPPVRR
jgi:transposase